MLKKWKLVTSVVLAIILLLGGTVYFLLKRVTREVENSNWSMEGEWIVFSCVPLGGSRGSLYLTQPDGSELTKLTTDRIIAQSPTWSPDGREIAFTSVNGLFKLKRGEEKLTRLTVTSSRIESVDYPSWSPDGLWIAFILRNPLEGDTLYRLSADGNTQETVIIEESLGSISWSSDGEWIAYRSLKDTNDFGIRKIRFDGTEVKSIVDRIFADSAWSPDGELIAFENGGIVLVRSNGTQMKRVIDLIGPIGRPAWSPDGQWIVFPYGKEEFTQLYKVRIDGSDLQQITHMDCHATMPDWIRMPENE